MAENKAKRNNATISFTDKSQKEEVQAILREQRLQNLMSDDVKGKDGKMVLWAIRYLKYLADNGKMRIEVPMFEDDSQEKQQMLDEIAQLKRDLYFCQLAVKKAKMESNMAPAMSKSIINDCYLTVLAHSHKFVDDVISKEEQEDIKKLFQGWQQNEYSEINNLII